jgi:hypothetical protein
MVRSVVRIHPELSQSQSGLPRPPRFPVERPHEHQPNTGSARQLRPTAVQFLGGHHDLLLDRHRRQSPEVPNHVRVCTDRHLGAVAHLLRQLGTSTWRGRRGVRNFIGQAEPVLSSTAERGLEGVVATRLDSHYTPGARSAAWVKHKHRGSEAFLITAWAPTQPSRPESFFPARRLADGTLEPAGSVSLGLSSEARERLRAELQASELPHRRRRQRVRALKPTLVATMDFHGPRRGTVRDPVLRSLGPS